MNAYNENLRDAVLQSLKSQEKVLKNIKAQANASMFTLYYAQSALITAGCKLLAAQDQVNENAGIKSEAVHNSNLSNNLLAFASQANQYLKQSVTYAGVTAANVQIAASSIVKLAGDIGSIFNIIHAGDFDTDVHVLAKEVNECISATTYDAELASQIGMEASALTAGVQASTVLAKAENNNTIVNNLLKQVSDALDTSSQLVAVENANLAQASAAEKKAEGAYEAINMVAATAINEYDLANNELNLDLKAYPVKHRENSTFAVEFYLLNSPFKEKETDPYYPVKDYYLFFVQHKQQSAFSIASARVILSDSAQKKRYIALSGLMKQAVTKDEKGKNKFKHAFNSRKISAPGQAAYVLQDTEGNDIKMGTDYVVFVLAVYHDGYKKRLNSFDDFISSASAKFRLANYLAAARFNRPMEKSVQKSGGQSIWFTVKENSAFEVEYRCIFLPVSKINFIFNLTIAEQVVAGNYIKVTGPGKPVVEPGKVSKLLEWEVPIADGSTDNFGNVLISGNAYIPVILSVAVANETELSKFKNTCTNFNRTRSFVFKQA